MLVQRTHKQLAAPAAKKHLHSPGLAAGTAVQGNCKGGELLSRTVGLAAA